MREFFSQQAIDEKFNSVKEILILTLERVIEVDNCFYFSSYKMYQKTRI